MGADLSINHPKYFKQREAWDKQFSYLCSKRDECPKDSEEVQTWQKRINEHWDTLYGVKGCGEFRDSYNHSNCLWVLGMSYWEMSEEKDLFDEEGNLSPAGCKALLSRLNEATARPESVIFKEFWESKENSESEWDKEWVSRLSPEDKADWEQYWTGKWKSLKEILQFCIDNKCSLWWSV